MTGGRGHGKNDLPTGGTAIGRTTTSSPARGAPPTIRDVARVAGVSPGTVSNVLTARRPVGAAIAERVRAAVRELGYVADRGAARLRTRDAAIVAALVPDLRNPFFAGIVAGLERRARDDGFELFVASGGDDPGRERARLCALIAWRPAGIVAIPADDGFAARDVIRHAGLPCVVVDRIPDACSFDSVAVDNAAASATALRHLLGRGHAHVLVVASSLALRNVRERVQGALEVAQGPRARARVEVLEVGLEPAAARLRTAARLAREPRPNAIFALTVDATLGALGAIAAQGLHVPADIALLGFDDYAWMESVNPPISAVRQPIEAIAADAWAALRDRIAGADGPPRVVLHPCSLEVRASSAGPQANAPATVRPIGGGELSSGRMTMKLSRRNALQLGAGAIAAGSLAGTSRWALAANDPLQIATVVKIGGIPWFNAMEVGIQKAGEEQKVNAWMIGPTQADAAQQVRAVEDLIARKVDVICVVPNDATALEPVFQRAQEAGIKVLTHESPDQKYNDWNIELTTVAGFGETHMEALARAMGEEGKYIVYVGSLTVPLHNKWADAAIALQKEKYPKMELVADRFGVAESLDDSYKTALDQMRAHPDLKGILAFGSQGPIGAARAVDERGKAESVAVVGPFSPGQGAQFIKSGAIREGFIWNPMLAGETIVRVGAMVARGEPITDGMELPGLGKVSVDAATRNILAQKLQPINKETIDELVAMGL